MEYRTASGIRMPALGFGTWDLRGETCTRMVRHALEIGYRHLDGARMYGNETEVGQGIADSGVAREDVFVTTKVWLDSLARDAVRRSLEESLTAVKTDYVDLFLIHWPNPTTPLAETLEVMGELQQAGRTRHIGVANFTVALMREAVEDCGAAIVCNQVEYHPWLSQRSVLNYARANGITVTAYCPLAQGKYDARDGSTLTPIAERHGKSRQQILLRWLLQQDAVAPIPKTSSEAHCRANFDIFDFELSQTEMQEITDLAFPGGRICENTPSPDWDID